MVHPLNKIREEVKQKYGFNGDTTNKDMNFFILKRLDDIHNKVNDNTVAINNQKMFCKIHLKEKSIFSNIVYKSMTFMVSFVAVCIAVFALVS